MISIHNLQSTSQQAFTLENNSKFGEKKQGKILYSRYEALYLIESKKAKLTNKKTIKLSGKDKLNYIIFKDLRKKGYIVKTGSKFGIEFRVYKKLKKGVPEGAKPLAHAQWLVHPTTTSNKLNYKDFTAKNRIAHATGKKLLIALIDSQEDITYYEIDWVKP